MKAGKLIVFEGANEVGKSTLARMLAAELRQGGERAKLLAFPGNQPGTLGSHVYALHHDPRRFQIPEINPTSLQILHVAAHIEAIDGEIIPGLKRGETIVLDRFWWSTWVYGCVAGASKKTLDAAIRVESTHWGKLRPDHIFLITRSAPLAPVPAQPIWAKHVSAYQSLAKRERRQSRVSVIANETTPEAAIITIRACLAARHRRSH